MDQIILEDAERKKVGWRAMHVKLQECAHECNLPPPAKPRYEIVSREVWDEEFDFYWEMVKKIEPHHVAPYMQET